VCVWTLHSRQVVVLDCVASCDVRGMIGGVNVGRRRHSKQSEDRSRVFDPNFSLILFDVDGT
jgi:hypothetical protein